ncbi:ANTAR domain-containing protein [Allosaccharopolyspora coralli]|uniref:ANTAR domain-containing protein n=1 Tax=Allosaccharopolyspora coralli TaxID=2665642 RepID=A0A5Q3Q5A2_9PSEU|nr:ANTAR domain-containing protein [Allosaccharopolyspora coralli]
MQSGTAITSPDLHTEQRWPSFTRLALQAGYQAAAAVPLRSRHQIIGSLTLLGTEPDGLEHASIQLGQALADMATIGLLQQRASRRGDLLAGQLQAVLHHRVVIEQAKGVLAEAGNMAPEDAYRTLRDHARQHGQHLSELARGLATGTIRPHEFLATRPASDDTTR